MTTIEFTDRYGGRTPSWLRACFNHCEGMGYVPIFSAECLSDVERKGRVTTESEHGKWLPAWRKAEAKEHASDGWHFVTCPDCHGSGRVPWYVSLVRIPKWLWRGCWLIWHAPDVRPDWSWWKGFKLKVWAAWGADLEQLRN